MAKIFGQLEEAQLQNRTSDPSNTPDGLMWIRTDTDTAKFYDGASVRSIVTTDQTQTLTNKTIDSDSNTITNIVNADIKAAAGINVNKLEALTASRVVISDGSGFISAADTSTYPSLTELSYGKGVTSSIQTQLDAKVAKSLVTTKGDLIVATGNATPTRIGVGADGTFLKANSSASEGVEWGSATNNLAVSSKTSAYTLATSDDVILADSSSAAFTLTLPTAVGNTGKVFRVKKTDSSFNAVTIDGDGTETIDGATTTTLNTQDETLTIVSDGSNWEIIERKIPSVWTSYTPTFSNSGTVSSTDIQWARVGPHILIRGTTVLGTVGTGAWAMSLPSGLTISVSTGTTNIPQLGSIFENTSSASNYKRLVPLATDGESEIHAGISEYSIGILVTTRQNADTMFTSSTRIFFDGILIKITGWNG
jgi:hypothetical protein